MVMSDKTFNHIKDLLSKGAVPEVIAILQNGLHEKPINEQYVNWLLKQAIGWQAQGLLEEQRQLCEWVLSCQPGNYLALHLAGYNAQLRGDYELAEKYFKNALLAKPDYSFSQLAYAQLRMMQTLFHEGRDTYEARFEAVTEATGPDWRGLPIKRWQGEQITDRHFYIWAEQGLGDIIMFAGFLPYFLSQSPRRIVLGIFPKLVSLFMRSFPDVIIEPIDDAANHALAPTMQTSFPHIAKLATHTPVPFSLEPLKASYDYVTKHGLFDIAAPMGDVLVYCLPHIIPARRQLSYILPDSNRVMKIREQLRSVGTGKFIGISWYTQNTRETNRNISLKEWLPLLAVPGCHFVSLQHHVLSQEIEAFCSDNNCKITVLPDLNLMQDAEGLAALIAAMDKVVTIDNSNVHLAGAMGIDTTLLLPKGCNYRWPEYENDRTLWYQSVKVIRQIKLYDWKQVMVEAVAQLKNSTH